MELPATSTTRKESPAWTDAYAQPGQARRRRVTISRKLALLGIAAADHQNTVLDLCCGNGETLDALYDLGFRDLHGADIAMPPELQADHRFATHIGDAAEVPLASSSVDWVLVIHALHHLGPVTHIEAVLNECHRVLKPGGRLALVDFPDSLQIRLAFWFFRQNVGLWTPYLKNFGKLIQEEWGFLREYLADWPAVDRLLRRGPWEVESHRQGLFYFYRTLRKPLTHEQPVDQLEWASIHKKDASWRKQLIGEINDVFVVPRYVKLFYDTFGGRRDQKFLEVGSGNGDLSQAVLAANRGEIARYTVSDYTARTVAWLRELGLDAIQADAQALPCADAEYDAVIDFDVMHHVDDPRAMAREMMRVGRGKGLLVESNGLSLPRRLLELMPGHRAAGERSYTPGQYRSFFQGHAGYALTRFTIYPFLFPFKCPRCMLPALAWFNRKVETLPLIRWQCSSVAIVVEYERTKA